MGRWVEWWGGSGWFSTDVGQNGALFVFFFNDTATTEIYTLSLHDALPILSRDLAMLSPIEHM